MDSKPLNDVIKTSIMIDTFTIANIYKFNYFYIYNIVNNYKDSLIIKPRMIFFMYMILIDSESKLPINL